MQNVKIAYNGKPLMRGLYVRKHVDSRLEGMSINGVPLEVMAVEVAVGETDGFGSSVEEARANMLPRVLVRKTGPYDKTLSGTFENTHEPNGRPLNVAELRAIYKEYQQQKCF